MPAIPFDLHHIRWLLQSQSSCEHTDNEYDRTLVLCRNCCLELAIFIERQAAEIVDWEDRQRWLEDQ